jgi:hypothetical protein
VKTIYLSLSLAAVAVTSTNAHAQTNDALDALKQQMQQMQQQMQLMQQKIDELEAAKTSAPPATVTAPAPAEAVTPEQVKELNEKVNQVVEAQKKTLLSEFNPSIGFVGETIFQYTSKNQHATGTDQPGGFDVNQRSMELNIAASVDPFAKGYAVINAQADPVTGESSLEVEEAAIQTTALPLNLELKAGQFFGEFGRLSYIHDHELPFVNRPLVLDQYVGGESKTIGAQVNWLVPIQHYVSLTAGVGDQFGDVPNEPGGFRSLDELNYWGRLSTYFELTPDWQIETGVSGLINPSTGISQGGALEQPNGSTLTQKGRLLGDWDFSLRYVPLQNNQFRSFTWGTEVLYGDNRYLDDPDGIPSNGDEFSKDVGSIGLYTYMAYKFSRQWTAGFLFDYVESDQDVNARTFAYSPYLTLALSHWNQLRLQYTHTDQNAETGLKGYDAVYLQWTWIIGSHAHGWQQR